MSAIERTVKIASIRGVGERVHLELFVVELSLIPPHRAPKPERVIEPLPKTEVEKMAREYARATFDELKRLGMPTTPSQVRIGIPTPIRFSLLLSKEEYEKLGKPTVYDELKLRIEVKGVLKSTG